MTWLTFFGYWGLLLVGFVAGCAWKTSRTEKLAQELETWKRVASRQAEIIEMLSRAVYMKVSKPQKRERFDWKAGTGVE